MTEEIMDYGIKTEPSVYLARARGREFCQTEGSEHYRRVGVEPLELIITCGYGEGFCLGSVIKYVSRYHETRSLEDLKKAADYIHILVGVELAKEETP